MTTYADILGAPRKVVGPSGLTIVYRPSSVTPKILKRFAEEGFDENPDDRDVVGLMNAYCELLPMFVLSWDLEDEQGPVPLESERLEDVPLEILDHAYDLIQRDREARASEEKNVSSASTEAKEPGSTNPSSMGSPPNGSGSSTPLASTVAVPGNS